MHQSWATAFYFCNFLNETPYICVPYETIGYTLNTTTYDTAITNCWSNGILNLQKLDNNKLKCKCIELKTFKTTNFAIGMPPSFAASIIL